MRRIEFEEQAITDFQCTGRRAIAAETDHRISTVAVPVDQMVGRLQHARCVACRYLQPRQRIRRQILVPRRQFTPGDFTVAVGIQTTGVFKIAQRDIPLPGDMAGFRFETQITVTGFVRLRSRTGHHQQQPHQQPFHGLPPPSFCANTASCGSSCLDCASQSSTGCAASRRPAATAASSRMRAS